MLELFNSQAQIRLVGESLGNQLEMSEAHLEELRQSWEILMQDLRNNLGSRVHGFSDVFQDFLSKHAISMTEFSGIVQKILDQSKSGSEMDYSHDLSTLQAYESRIHQAEQDARAVGEFLAPENLLQIQSRICNRDLLQIGYEEICSPQGLIDQMVESLNRIGRGDV